MRQGMNKLVIDLRGNGGGPPLAAREIVSYILPPGTDMIYFQRKNRPKALLKTFPTRFTYKGEITILIDKGTGSSSELFSWTLKGYDRAVLMGFENSAGKTFLKSMFNLKDESMLFLVTSLAYLYNGTTFDPNGLTPDFILPGEENMFPFIAESMDKYYGQIKS
jgi:carboxyl-terminal processing protease